MTWFLLGILVLLPPKWDLAIRLKEWNEKRGHSNKK